MKYSYVPEVIQSSPLTARAFDKERSSPGFVAGTDKQGVARMKLGDFLYQKWLPAIYLEVEPTTYRSYEGHVRRHINPYLGDVRICDITRDLLKELYVTLMQTPVPGSRRVLKKGTVERVHVTLHRAFAMLVDAEVLDRNPARGARPKRRKSEQYEIRVWTPEELQGFFVFARKDPLFALWRLLALTGIRRGEAMGLRWFDINFRIRTMAVRRSLNWAGVPYLSTPKSSQARVLELDDETLRVLNRFRHHQRRVWAKSGPSLAADDFVFCNDQGEPLLPSWVTKHFKTLVTEAGVPVIRLHDLRHTHASHLIESGAHPKVVQERLGHADVVITLNIYSHLFPTTHRDAVDRLALLYRE